MTESDEVVLRRWAVIASIGARVFVEAESAEAARLKAELRGYTVLEVWPDDSTQAVSF
jgi:hypothetical protein